MESSTVRSVYFHGKGGDNCYIYSERILYFKANNLEETANLANAESLEYLKLNPSFKLIGSICGFGLTSDSIRAENGTELWCMLFESDEPPEEFYNNRYAKYLLSEEKELDYNSLKSGTPKSGAP